MVRPSLYGQAILFKPLKEDEPQLDALRKARPGVSDSQLIRELVHRALDPEMKP